MEEFVEKLITKVGLSKEQAEKVVDLVKEHAADVPKWLASSGIGKALADKLPGGLGGMFK